MADLSGAVEATLLVVEFLETSKQHRQNEKIIYCAERKRGNFGL
jgi:hypothetical protein